MVNKVIIVLILFWCLSLNIKLNIVDDNTIKLRDSIKLLAGGLIELKTKEKK